MATPKIINIHVRKRNWWQTRNVTDMNMQLSTCNKHPMGCKAQLAAGLKTPIHAHFFRQATDPQRRSDWPSFRHAIRVH